MGGEGVGYEALPQKDADFVEYEVRGGGGWGLDRGVVGTRVGGVSIVAIEIAVTDE